MRKLNSPDITYWVSHETWQLFNGWKCLLPKLVKFFDIKEKNIEYAVWELSYIKMDYKVKYIWVNDF